MAQIKNFGLVGVGSSVQFGKGGASILSSGGILAAKDATGQSLVNFQVAMPTHADDATSKSFVDGAVATLNTTIAAVSSTLTTALAGAGLNTSGTYSANGAAKYISGAASLKAADDLLDAALFAANTTLTTALNAAFGTLYTGVYSPTGTFAISGATSVANAADLLDAALAAEQARALLAEASLNTAIQNVSTSAIATLQAGLSLEASTRASGDASLLAMLNSEVTTARSAESLLSNAIANETTARQAADTSLLASLNSEVSRAQLAEGTLIAGLTSETNRAMAAEATLGADLTSETARAEAAEATLSASISAEATTARNAETSLATSIATEATRAGTAEASLATSISTEATTRANADTSLATSISAEAARAVAAEATLSASIATNAASIGSLDTRLTTVEGNYIKKDGSVAFTGDINAGSNHITNLANPVNAGDAVNLAYVNSKISSLGSVFHFVGTIDGGAQNSPVALNSLADHTTGAYYKVTTAGYFTDGTTTFLAQALDGLVKTPDANGWEVIGHVDTVVSGTTNFVAVSGSVDTGFTVDIDSTFKGRVATAEANISTLTTGLASEITLARSNELSLNVALTSTNTALGNEIASRQSADTSLDAALTAEIGRATAAEATLTAAVSSEVTRAQAAEASIANNLATEISRAQTAEGSLSAALIVETGRAEAVETLLTSSIAAEATTARAAETSLSNALTSEISTARANESSLATALSNETTRATAEEASLQTQINALTTSNSTALTAEIARAEAAEATLTANLAQEVTDRSSADTSLATAISTEASTARAAEATLTTAIANEASTARAAEFTLTSNLNSEIARATAAEGTLTASLASEVTRATAAESAILATLSTDMSMENAARMSADATLQTQINAIEHSVGLDSTGAYVQPTSSNYLGSATSVMGGLSALDAALKTVSNEIDAARHDEIVSATEQTSVVVSDANGVVFSTSVNGAAKQVASIVGSAATNAALAIDVGTANSVKLMATGGAHASDAVDIHLTPQGSGHVYIGDTGTGVLQADDNQNLVISGGANTGSLTLSGAAITVSDLNNNTVAAFAPASGANYLSLSNGNGAATLAVTGNAMVPNADLVLAPKGTGSVSVSGSRVVNVAAPTTSTDAATKGYVDTLVSGSIQTRIVNVTETTGTVNLGAPVKGTVMRVRVLVNTAFTSGASITVGSATGSAELVPSSMVDETSPGAYLAEVSSLYGTATQLTVSVIAGSGSTGAAQVFIEYIS